LEPEVSVIVACFNKEKYIEQSLASVLQQSFGNFELLVIDDCSSDASAELVKRMQANDSRVRLTVNAENRGANFCRNEGIRLAKGRYLIFFDADDLLEKNCLEQRLQMIKADPTLDVSVHTMQVFRHNPGDSGFNWRPSVADPLKSFLAHDLPWQTMQPIWKKEVMVKAGGFDESFNRLQDVELHTRLLLTKGLRYRLVNAAPDCYYRIDESRKNYEELNFLQRWTSASAQYCSKFMSLVQPTHKKFLFGTVFQTYLSVLLSYKAQKIDRSGLAQLEEKLFSQPLMNDAPKRVKWMLRLARAYNLGFMRIPGMNRFLKKFVVM
jgi:glycosyltransferase involved in cell wall biosynthesis